MNINAFVKYLTTELSAQAVLCYGSFAQQLNDKQSDIDLLVLMNQTIPSHSLRERIYRKFPNTTIVSLGKDTGDWDVSWTPVNDGLIIDNQAIDIGYNEAGWVKGVIEHLIVKNQITFDAFPFRPYTFLGLLETSTILYEKDHFITSCLSQIRPMPLGLKKEIIHAFLPILKESQQELINYSERDIGILAYQFQLFRGMDALTSLLFAINEVYDPASKRTEAFLFKLKKQLPGLADFLATILPRFYENKKEVIRFFEECIKFIETNAEIG